jgi:hypothetical protein
LTFEICTLIPVEGTRDLNRNSRAPELLQVLARMAARKFAPDFMIMQRRKEEDQRSVFDLKKKTDSAIENYATWEHKTSGRIAKNAVAGQINTIKRDLEDHLNNRRCVSKHSTFSSHLLSILASPTTGAQGRYSELKPSLLAEHDPLLCCRLVYRRAKLAAMLNEEDAAYTRELQDLEETPEMRRDRLKSRARELVRRREKEKREFANLMRERQVRALSFSRFLQCLRQDSGTAP